MGPAFVATAWVMVVGLAFVPVFIAAMVLLRSVWRAFVLAAAFTAGAFAAFAGCGYLGYWLMNSETAGRASTTSLVLFSTAGAIAGGVLAVYLLNLASRNPPWKRQ